jgi:hypothetical protein
MAPATGGRLCACPAGAIRKKTPVTFLGPSTAPAPMANHGHAFYHKKLTKRAWTTIASHKQQSKPNLYRAIAIYLGAHFFCAVPI